MKRPKKIKILKLLTIETIKASVIADFDKFF